MTESIVIGVNLWEILGVIASIPIGLTIMYKIGYRACQHYVEENILAMKDEAYNALLIKGEQVGFEKGFISGKKEAEENFKREFVAFLEDQISTLKGILK